MNLILTLVTALVINTSNTNTNDILCPATSNLGNIDTYDKFALISALQEIIPNIYGNTEEYKEWNFERVAPMKGLVGWEKAYYKMAVNFCGPKVAYNSWFVRVRFPKLLPAQSGSLGELFLIKNKNNEWVVWYKYH